MQSARQDFTDDTSLQARNLMTPEERVIANEKEDGSLISTLLAEVVLPQKREEGCVRWIIFFALYCNLRAMPTTKTKTDLLKQVKRAINGLTYMSESDYPLEPFHMEGDGKDSITERDILKATHHAPKTPVETFDFNNFFLNATQEQDWHGAEEKQSVKRYQQLVKLLKENLSDIQVFKVGETEKDVYVVGKSKSGDFVGVSTKVVET
jgi:hypothetical protein